MMRQKTPRDKALSRQEVWEGIDIFNEEREEAREEARIEWNEYMNDAQEMIEIIWPGFKQFLSPFHNFYM